MGFEFKTYGPKQRKKTVEITFETIEYQEQMLNHIQIEKLLKKNKRNIKHSTYEEKPHNPLILTQSVTNLIEINIPPTVNMAPFRNMKGIFRNIGIEFPEQKEGHSSYISRGPGMKVIGNSDNFLYGFYRFDNPIGSEEVFLTIQPNLTQIVILRNDPIKGTRSYLVGISDRGYNYFIGNDNDPDFCTQMEMQNLHGFQEEICKKRMNESIDDAFKRIRATEEKFNLMMPEVHQDIEDSRINPLEIEFKSIDGALLPMIPGVTKEDLQKSKDLLSTSTRRSKKKPLSIISIKFNQHEMNFADLVIQFENRTVYFRDLKEYNYRKTVDSEGNFISGQYSFGEGREVKFESEDTIEFYGITHCELEMYHDRTKIKGGGRYSKRDNNPPEINPEAFPSMQRPPFMNSEQKHYSFEATVDKGYTDFLELGIQPELSTKAHIHQVEINSDDYHRQLHSFENRVKKNVTRPPSLPKNMFFLESRKLLINELEDEKIAKLERTLRSRGFLGERESLRDTIEKDSQYIQSIGITHEEIASKMASILQDYSNMYRDRRQSNPEYEKMQEERQKFESDVINIGNTSSPEAFRKSMRERLGEMMKHSMMDFEDPLDEQDEFQVRSIFYMCTEHCPFSNFSPNSLVTPLQLSCGSSSNKNSITNRKTKEFVGFGGLMIHIIHDHHFFGGKNTRRRVDPKILCRILGFDKSRVSTSSPKKKDSPRKKVKIEWIDDEED